MTGMDSVQLRAAIAEQLRLGKDGIQEEDYYLFEVNIHDLMEEPIDCIRGWLCDMLIARGDIAAAQDECRRVRPLQTVNSISISNHQRKEFMNWQNISITSDAFHRSLILNNF